MEIPERGFLILTFILSIFKDFYRITVYVVGLVRKHGQTLINIFFIVFLEAERYRMKQRIVEVAESTKKQWDSKVIH